MLQDGVKDEAQPEEALKGSAHSATYPVIDGRALKVSGCVREQQHDKENHNC